MKAYPYLESDEPLFANILKNKQTPHRAFFDEARKYIVDPRESDSFCMTVEYNHSTSIDLTRALSSRWFEFFDIKSFRRLPIQPPGGSEGVRILGFGYNQLDDQILFAYGQGDRIMLYPEAPTPVTCELMLKYTEFIQTEYVNATHKITQIGTRVKRGKPIKHYAPYQVIYRKQPVTKNISSGGEGTIEWDHRWRVRGHWRKVEGIGKDALGNDIEGLTWIKDFVKGPADKPLLDRPAIVKDQLPRRFTPVRHLQ